MKLTACSSYALRSLRLAAPKVPDRIKVAVVVRASGLLRPHVARIAPIGEGIVAPMRKAR